MSRTHRTAIGPQSLARAVSLRKVALWTGVALAAALVTSSVPASPPERLSASQFATAADELAARIDSHIEQAWQAHSVTPAELCDDSAFIRRVYLHLTGRIPTAGEVRDFLADTDPHKRDRLIDRLLEGSRFPAQMASIWRHIILPNENLQNFTGEGIILEQWLRDRFAEGTPYNELAHRIIVGDAGSVSNPYDVFLSRQPVAFGGQPNQVPLLQQLRQTPPDMTSTISRVFLGVQIQCAQCHDHPFATWSREQFWSLAAYFQQGPGVNLVPQAVPGKFLAQVFDDPERIQIPDTDTMVKAEFLDGTRGEEGSSLLESAAAWMTRPDNEYFARAAVNRIWWLLVGRGIVDPVDDMAGSYFPSHPELLDELAEAFIAHNFDVRFLMAAICRSRAYQVASEPPPAGWTDGTPPPETFAAAPLRNMSPEQLYDSVSQAIGLPYEEMQPGAEFAFAFGGGDFNRFQFLNLFDDPTLDRTDYQASLLQALTLMNGELVQNATSVGNSQLLTAVVNAPYMSDQERIETLYLATLSRYPDEEEMAMMLEYVAGAESREQGLSDVFWALLNTAEFVLIR